MSPPSPGFVARPEPGALSGPCSNGAESDRGGRRGHSELAPEGAREVAVAGIADVEREAREIAVVIGQRFQRRAQAQAIEVPVHGNSGLLLEEAAQVIEREPGRSGHFVESDVSPKMPGKRA